MGRTSREKNEAPRSVERQICGRVKAGSDRDAAGEKRWRASEKCFCFRSRAKGEPDGQKEGESRGAGGRRSGETGQITAGPDGASRSER